jgi:hypothetical protein
VKKPLLCRLGFHPSRFLDSTLTQSALRCNDCGAWIEKEKGRRVDEERRLYSAPPSATPETR